MAAHKDGLLGVALSANATNEDNFALGKLAVAWGIKQVMIAAKAHIPSRNDGRLMVADVNANTAGATAIASALGLEVTQALGNAKVLVVLGD